MDAFDSTRMFLNNNSNVIITEADKGNIPVAMDKKDYMDGMNTHYADKTKYRQITFDPQKTAKTK